MDVQDRTIRIAGVGAQPNVLQQAKLDGHGLELVQISEDRVPRFTDEIHFNKQNATMFCFDPKDPLRATNQAGELIQKFMWNPVTGEWRFVPPQQNHATVVTPKEFDDYVRGITLHERSTVAFRPFWPTWIRLNRHGLLDPYAEFDANAKMISWDAQAALQEVLERTKDGAAWTYQIDTNNNALHEMTGSHRW